VQCENQIQKPEINQPKPSNLRLHLQPKGMFFVAVGGAFALTAFEILRDLTQFYNETLSYKHKYTVINSYF
jgi:hypothetical protein